MTKNYLLFLLYIPLLAIFLLLGFTNGHSADFNYDWSVQYTKSFESGVYFPRHLNGLWGGLGGYDFFFYGPLPFWLISALISPLCWECSSSTELLLGAAFFLVLSGIAAYLFFRQFFNVKTAIFSSVLYCLMPYHLFVDWYVRQAYGEFASYVFLPLIAYGFNAILKNQPHKYLLAIGIAGMALCHLPTTLLAGHIFFVIFLIFLIMKILEKEPVRLFVFDTVYWAFVGFLLSSIYWLSAIVLLEYVQSDLLYSEHFVATNWLLKIGAEQTAPQFGITILLCFFAILPLFFLSQRHLERQHYVWVYVPIIFFVFLNTSISYLLWEYWIINKVQFPWRLMVFVDFSAAFAAAIVMQQRLKKGTAFYFVCVFCLIPIFLVIKTTTLFYVSISKESSGNAGAMEYFSPEMVKAARNHLNDDIDLFVDRPTVLTWSADIHDSIQEKNEGNVNIQVLHREVSITLLDNTIAEMAVPIQYWGLWEVQAPVGDTIKIQADEITGTILLKGLQDIETGQNIRLNLPYHWSETYGLYLSLLGVFLFLFRVCLDAFRKNGKFRYGSSS